MRNQRLGRFAASSSLVLLVGSLVGCEVSTADPAPPKAPESQRVLEGGGSAMGKAIDNAHNLQDQVKVHNDEIAKQAEDASKAK